MESFERAQTGPENMGQALLIVDHDSSQREETDATFPGHTGATTLDPENTSLLNLFCAWSIGLTAYLK